MAKFELFVPVTPLSFNQRFGENPLTYARYGIKGHNGNDLMAIHGQPVYAAHDGTAFFETDSDGGEGVVIITNQPFDYSSGQSYFKSIYWHLADYTKEPHYKSPVLDYQQQNKKGMPVKRGDLIGFADNTGYSTGDHLHFGLKPIKPSLQGNSPEDATDEGIGNWQNVEQLNGFKGAIDPEFYLNGIPANSKRDFLYDMGLMSVSGDVLELQRRLSVLPAVSYLPVGIFGPKTKAAVIAYQAKNGLPQTGYVGPRTRALLNKI